MREFKQKSNNNIIYLYRFRPIVTRIQCDRVRGAHHTHGAWQYKFDVSIYVLFFSSIFSIQGVSICTIYIFKPIKKYQTRQSLSKCFLYILYR